jgi:MFS family permease
MITGKTEKSMRGAIGPLLATFSIQTVAAVALFGVAVIAPVAAPEIGVDATLIGTFSAIVYSAGMLGGLLTGAFADRFGAIRVSQVLMALAVLSVSLLTFSTPLAAIVSAVCLGFCYGPVNPVSTHILARVTSKDRRPLFFSIKQTGMPAGAGIAGLLLPMVTAAYDWRAAILMAGVMAAAVALLIQPLRGRLDAIRQPTRMVRMRDVTEPVQLIWQNYRLRSLAIVGFVYSGVQVTVMTFYVVYLTAALSLALTTAGVVFTLLQLGAILGRLFWGAIAERYLPATPLLVGLGVVTGGLTVAAGLYDTGWPFWSVGLVSFILGATSAGWNGIFFSELVKYAPGDRTGETASGMQVFIMAGVAAMPPVFGLIVVAMGDYRVAFALVAAAMVAAAVHHKVVFR